MNKVEVIKKGLILLRAHFFAGVLIIIPIAVIGWLLLAALGTIWALQEVLPLAWRPENYLPNAFLVLLVKLAFTIACALVLALGISTLGWASKQFLGGKILRMIGDFIQKIPILRSIYSALDQLLKTLAANGDQQFNRVVYFEYPRKGVWVIAFVTGPAKSTAFPSGYLNIYVPTTPNPTSGFHLIVPETEVRDSNLKVEDAFKILLSLGIAQNDNGTTSK